MSIVAFLLLVGSASADLAAIDKALDEALTFDRRAYVQICDQPARQKVFEVTLARANALNDIYASRLAADTLIMRYVDRRPVNVCSNGESFEGTMAEWNTALDRIERDLKGAG